MPGVLLAVLVGLAFSQVALFCTTIYLHRALSHRAITLRPSVRMVFRVLIWLMTGIRPRQWVAVHRKHHAFTDVEGDPHSPVLLGFWRVQLTNAALYRKVARDGTTTERYAKDLPPDRWDKLLFDHAFIGLGIGITMLCLVLGWQLGLLAAAVHALSYLALNAAINAVGHSYGKKSYPNTAFNNQWLAFVTGGEGLHNNHHAAPTSAKLALARHEIDPAWWVIRLMVRARMATVRLTETRFVPRSASSMIG
ncbi:MAG: fatty acid desaturase [Acidimicrobiales bacterium]